MKMFKEAVPVDDQWHRRPGTPVAVAQQTPLHVTYWFRSDGDLTTHEYRVFGTGHEAEGEYVGTVQEGPFVWHLFRRPVTS